MGILADDRIFAGNQLATGHVQLKKLKNCVKQLFSYIVQSLLLEIKSFLRKNIYYRSCNDFSKNRSILFHNFWRKKFRRRRTDCLRFKFWRQNVMKRSCPAMYVSTHVRVKIQIQNKEQKISDLGHWLGSVGKVVSSYTEVRGDNPVIGKLHLICLRLPSCVPGFLFKSPKYIRLQQ